MILFTLAACGNEADVTAEGIEQTSDDVTVRRYEETLSDETSGTVSTQASNPASICMSDGWDDMVSEVMNETGHEDGGVDTVSTGRGCRATDEKGEIEVRLEVISPGSLNAISDARKAVADNETALMGFEELEFKADNDSVSSSLQHTDLERLEEHRWMRTGQDRAFHLLVALEPDGPSSRTSLLDIVSGLEPRAESLVDEHTSSSPSDQEVTAVMDAVVDITETVIEGESLGDKATPDGADTIAFEYAFPENMAGILAYRDDMTCTSTPDGARCEIDALEAQYRFDFVPQDGAWLLDDFRVDS